VKGYMVHNVDNIHKSLKRREKSGQVVVVDIDEYLSSQASPHIIINRFSNVQTFNPLYTRMCFPDM
jgi:hypothetical protein